MAGCQDGKNIFPLLGGAGRRRGHLSLPVPRKQVTALRTNNGVLLPVQLSHEIISFALGLHAMMPYSVNSSHPKLGIVADPNIALLPR